MSDYFTQLAGIALGRPDAGAARLSLPPRFARLAADAGLPDPAETDQLAVDRPAGAQPGSTPAPMPTDGTVRVTLPPGEASPLPVAPPPAARPPIGLDAQPRIESVPAPAAHAPVLSRPPLRGAAPSDPAPAEAAAPGFPPPADRLAPISMRRAGIAADDSGPPGAAPFGDRAAPFAPLSEAAIAVRAADARTAEPVIHVTIDRIDVRAPAPSRPAPAARRAPADPSMSLADFLSAGPARPRP